MKIYFEQVKVLLLLSLIAHYLLIKNIFMHEYYAFEVIFQCNYCLYHESIVLLRSIGFFLPGLNQQKVMPVFFFFRLNIFFSFFIYIYIYLQRQTSILLALIYTRSYRKKRNKRYEEKCRLFAREKNVFQSFCVGEKKRRWVKNDAYFLKEQNRKQ